MTEHVNGNGWERDAVGSQSLATLRSAPESYREPVRDRLSAVLEQWCDNVCEGVRKRQRNAMNLWAKAMGIVGAEVEVNVNLATTREFGLSVSELHELIAAYRGSGAATIEECRSEGVKLLRWVMDQEPEWRAGILAELGGPRALESHENGSNGST